MKLSRIFLSVSTFGALTMASLSAHALDCNNAMTTRDMVECAQMDYNIADGDLNYAYQDLRAGADKTGKLKLRDAQRAWIKFRDAECDRQADAVRGGTMAPLIQMSCLADLTAKRAAELGINPMTGESN
ncbi:lysozyme inhibitor LprI family protein [Cohaesibacter celericrescens]|jgi:uncharacterized protein YecT (DUF1311 family)|uniref:Lysozyme inhibitor LprI-like N-terminal domain-containing protein n=1 Tax=Cohaesibacter celericrescens TaxID=2067669 RepID=A0A2N5XKS1_9HYPH|nr:lysozyme inhibitor LprI family protein [Cohaesibacter celericrescens]PLW75092.1 hypothetical protein C0081_22660 [Cohaesibacter celericrescens]